MAFTFPGAQDFILDIACHDPGTCHRAGRYLGHAAVAGLVADALYTMKEPARRATADIAVRMSDAEASALLLQHFAEAVANNIKDADRAERYRATLKILRDDLAAQLTQRAAAGQLLAPEMLELIDGKLPPLPQRWEIHEAIGQLVVLALTNCIAPYEIDPGEASIKALEDIAEELGFRRQIGAAVAAAIKDVQARVREKEKVPGVGY